MCRFKEGEIRSFIAHLCILSIVVTLLIGFISFFFDMTTHFVSVKSIKKSLSLTKSNSNSFKSFHKHLSLYLVVLRLYFEERN